MFKFSQFLNVYRMDIAIYVYYYGNGNSGFGCGYSNAEEGKHIALEQLRVAVGVEHCKIYIHCVEHKLGAYEQRHQVAACEEPEYSYEKEYCREYEKILCGYYHRASIFCVQ